MARAAAEAIPELAGGGELRGDDGRREGVQPAGAAAGRGADSISSWAVSRIQGGTQFRVLQDNAEKFQHNKTRSRGSREVLHALAIGNRGSQDRSTSSVHGASDNRVTCSISTYL